MLILKENNSEEKEGQNVHQTATERQIDRETIRQTYKKAKRQKTNRQEENQQKTNRQKTDRQKIIDKRQKTNDKSTKKTN